MFFGEILRRSGLLRAQAEDALSELASLGLVTSDGFGGVRGLIAVRTKRPTRRRSRAPICGLEEAGRWSLLVGRSVVEPPDVEHVARVLLARWGVVFRRLIDREIGLPRWRDLLRVLRRLEARGEVRGGRFVEGVSGEQYALADAIAPLRDARRRGPDSTIIRLSATDPLNLIGVLIHRSEAARDASRLGEASVGPRVSRVSSNHLVFRDAIPIAALESHRVRWLGDETESKNADVQAVLRRRVVPAIRAYLGAKA